MATTRPSPRAERRLRRRATTAATVRSCRLTPLKPLVTSQVLTSNNLHAMGSQNVAYNHSHHNSNPQPRANLFRRFPLRSILKNGKVHNSSQATTTGEESGPPVPLSQPKSGILKKATTAEEAVITIGNGSIPSAAVQQQQQHNGGNPANSSSTSNHPPQSQPLPILQVSPSSASSHASAKSAASLVQFAGSPSQPELPQQRKENSCDTSSPSSEAAAAMSSSAAAVPSVPTVSAAAAAAADTSTSAVGRAYAIASAAAAAASTSQPPSHHLQQQPLSVNRLQVPPNPNHPSTTSTTTPTPITPSPLSLITTTTRPSTSSAANLTRNPSLSAIGPSASVVASNGSLQPSYYTATTTQRISDLRRILNPEVEKEDSFKKFTEAIENCDCFEFNLNNAAKLITVLVLLATLVLVIRALKGDR
ncbi:hypothetical protein TYRP_009256 [Tyrophagus putrescentiae]|nr:hypothetical protein TYRP_009256 [Tyrophagus putrescentiae]